MPIQVSLRATSAPNGRIVSTSSPSSCEVIYLPLNVLTDFEVKDPLPNVTFPLNRNFAGNIPVNRAGHPNDTLFFWGFEHKNGSLTSESNLDTPWAIWLNGG